MHVGFILIDQTQFSSAWNEKKNRMEGADRNRTCMKDFNERDFDTFKMETV